jgi:prepilin peptidase CpaA
MFAVFQGHQASFGAWCVVVFASLVAAVIDVRSWRIPNLLTFPLLLSGLAFSRVLGGTSGLADSFLGCLIAASPFVALFLFSGGGAGDAKFMGAVGSWLGVRGGLLALLCVLSAGVVIGLGMSLVRGRGRQVLRNLILMSSALTLAVVGRRGARQAISLFPEQEQMLKMPYGLTIFAGVCIAAGSALRWHL